MPFNEYAAVPNFRSATSGNNAVAEMDNAFDSDDDEQLESTPLARSHPPTITVDGGSPPPIPGAYDFERDYDYPPPGSPPRSSALALPNAYGNTNGSLPSPTAVQDRIPRTFGNTPSFFRRAVGAILPTHYTRVPTAEESSTRNAARGGGMENDGVFANVMAKPAPPRTVTVQNDNGDIYVMPEETQKDVPPSYSAAQADAVPPYWETTVHAPHVGGIDDDMIIDGLPSGSLFSFAWNLLISMSFQFVGFMLTYVLHTTHAAKFGSRAGLGITLIQYGLYSRGSDADLGFGGNDGDDTTPGGNGDGQVVRAIRRGAKLLRAKDWAPLLSTSPTNVTYEDPNTVSNTTAFVDMYSRDWLSFLLMTIGWFLLLSSLLGFLRVKRWESSIRASSNPQPPPSPEALAHDVRVRERLSSVFGLDAEAFDDDEEEGDEGEHSRRSEAEESAPETRMRRTLHSVGLL